MPDSPTHPADDTIVPKDPATQRVLAKEIEEWWSEQTLQQKLWIVASAESAVKQHRARN